jgi:hypothetical protein
LGMYFFIITKCLQKGNVLAKLILQRTKVGIVT